VRVEPLADAHVRRVERIVLEHAYDHVDAISAHAYYHEIEGDLASFLASTLDMEHVIATVTATADAVGARQGSARRIGISFDEWNVWYVQRHLAAAREHAAWPIAPRVLEDIYTVADAVVVGSMLITLLKHADRVTAASLAQLVNVIAPIMTEPGGPAWRQTIFFPFARTSALAQGVVLRPDIAAPSYATVRHGEAPIIDAVATFDEAAGGAALFLVNRATTPTTVDVDMRDLGPMGIRTAQSLWDDDVHATNTVERPDRVGLRPTPVATMDGGRLHLELPPVSWTAVAVAAGRAATPSPSDANLARPAKDADPAEQP
jgi:alpha-N-arabinofuranosidase